MKRLLTSSVWMSAVVLLATGWTHSAAEETQTPRPNILFIFADDWGWGDLSCHGHPWLKTPNIDRLAREGTDFLQFNVLNPVCSPSRTAALTGMYPARFCIHQHFAHPALNREHDMPDWLTADAPTLPRFLKQAGYATGHFGKWHLTNRQTHGAPRPEAYGFDEFAVFNGSAEWPSADLHATAVNAVRFIRTHRDRPFYVNVWLHESHTPHVPTAESMARWAHLDEQKQVYSAVITDGDNAVGLILDALDREGLADNTIVIFSSDNGPEWTHADQKHKRMGAGYGAWASIGQTGGLRGKKRSLFEGGVRTPFIVRWPGHTPAGVTNDTTVVTAVDLLPTRGIDLEPDWWPRLAVRDGDWKLLLTCDAKRVELHRVTEDRGEAVDVAQEHLEIVARLTKAALAWKAALPVEPDPACIDHQSRAKAQQSQAVPAARSRVSPEVRARAFARWDTDGDGFLTLDEYKVGLAGQSNLESRFRNFDRNDDGRVTREEFIGPGPHNQP